MITVYGKPQCQQCRATRKVMSRLKVPFSYIDVTEQPEVMPTIRELGYQSLPVVTITEDGATVKHWNGFRPALLATLKIQEA